MNTQNQNRSGFMTPSHGGIRQKLIERRNDMTNDDYCYECTGYGDDYYIDDDGEMVRSCDTCPHNHRNWEDEA